MRIIAGQSKGMSLMAVKGRNTRPTSEKVKESIFNIIQDRILDSVVLDLFAGTGNLGFEALSRGAKKAFFIDRDIAAVGTIKMNCRNLGYEKQSEIFRSDALVSLTGIAKRDILFDIIFADPPYHYGCEDTLLSAIDEFGILCKYGIVIIEHDAKSPLPDRVSNLYCSDRRKYGGTGISFYRKG
ncbi:MAG TPA: 16S rRNA (guanine(966)-N(2))-methyltransferase RsmD [Clostridia bacterium]|nr:16S rRNA (guanine(966)-N(2))-methyltransferase RsmD [Clostridia bacterium]